MPWNRTHPKQKPTKPIQARTLRLLAETCDWASRIRVIAPLEMNTFGGGPQIRLNGLGAQLAYTDSGGITARVGTTAGYGQVYYVASTVTWSAGVPTCTLATGTDPMYVFNFSATTGGIAGGLYCFVEQDVSGNWWITAIECG